MTTRSILISLLAIACGFGGPLARTGQETPGEPAPSSLVEKVDVQLVELKVSVTDRKGNPVTDVSRSEVTVLEKGRPQRVAFFEPVATRELVSGEEAPMAPAPLYDAEGGSSQGAVEDVLPPRPVRRIILAFDPRNSRSTVRESWREAALSWVEENMQPNDRVAIVLLRRTPEWIGPMSSDRNAILNSLRGLDLHTDISNRNRRNEITEFIGDLRSLCEDTTGKRGPAGGTADLREIGCAYDIARPLVFEWSRQTEESVEVLRALSGQLAAIPGEKIVVLFSEGIIDDPGQVLVNAMLNVFSYERINVPSMKAQLSGERHWDLSNLHRASSAANVVFFTLDTRHANEGSNFGNLEQTSAMTTGMLAVNPWKEMYDSTRSTLSALAYATGGRPFYGGDELVGKIEKASGSFYGIYTLGYYRSDPGTAFGKVRVKIKRKKLMLEYDNKPRLRVHQPGPAQLDMMVGRAEALPDGLNLLPVALLTPLAQLPLRQDGAIHGCEVGVFIQAISPDGSVIADSFETVTVVLSAEDYAEARAKKWQHFKELELPDGPLRLRARISDDRQVILADRSIDLTLSGGEVLGGFHEAGD